MLKPGDSGAGGWSDFAVTREKLIWASGSGSVDMGCSEGHLRGIKNY